MSSILITGITGYFGALLIPWLMKYQGSVIYLVRGGPNRFLKIYNSYRPEDSVLDFDLVSDSADDIIAQLSLLDVWPDKIIHLAASVKFGEEVRDNVMRTNLGGTQKIVKVAKHFGAELIFFSTYYVHGAWPKNKVFKEEFSYCRPNNPYEESKQKCELAIRNSGLTYKIIRPSILADCRETGYLGLLRYFWFIRDFFSKHREKLSGEIFFAGNIINLPLEGEYYKQKDSTLNFIVSDWVRRFMPHLIVSDRKNIIIHLINEDPPTSAACFADAFHDLMISPFSAKGIKYSHNLMLKQMVLRIFSNYLSSAPLADCANLRIVLGDKYQPHPSGDELRGVLKKTLFDAVDSSFGLSIQEISKLERILNI
ncbi:MAG TPA: NAD(P)-dependent oxidoreductase [Candidatus Nanoarchaeia archaeon]|nr:NAD(P)-dependent oxidoreductase [Candidatus Nanoarchaeia archaeon]